MPREPLSCVAGVVPVGETDFDVFDRLEAEDADAEEAEEEIGMELDVAC